METNRDNEIDRIVEALDVGAWSFSNEREFMENLYVGRFNYFLVIFSLFLTAGFANTFTVYKSVVFYVGAFILFLVWLPLLRGYKKHDRIMRIMFQNMPEHPANRIEAIMELEGFKPKYKVSKLMGVYIPWFCIFFLLAIALSISCSILK
jgi:hypothetical protein